MQIQFERSGGFTGMVTRATIDTSQLPPDDATALLELIQDANFFALPTVLPEMPGAADQFQYVITVDTGDDRHTVRAGDQSAPESLQPLLRHLTRLARSQPGN